MNGSKQPMSGWANLGLRIRIERLARLTTEAGAGAGPMISARCHLAGSLALRPLAMRAEPRPMQWVQGGVRATTCGDTLGRDCRAIIQPGDVDCRGWLLKSHGPALIGVRLRRHEDVEAAKEGTGARTTPSFEVRPRPPPQICREVGGCAAQRTIVRVEESRWGRRAGRRFGCELRRNPHPSRFLLNVLPSRACRGAREIPYLRKIHYFQAARIAAQVPPYRWHRGSRDIPMGLISIIPYDLAHGLNAPTEGRFRCSCGANRWFEWF